MEQVQEKKVKRQLYRILHNKEQSPTLSVRQNTPLNLILPESKLNPRAFHAYVRSKTSIKEEVMALRGEDGTFTASLSESCQLLNKEFEKVFVRNDNQPIRITKEFNGVKLTTCAVTEDDVVKEHLMNLKVPSAPGSESIHLVPIKKCAASVCKHLCSLSSSTKISLVLLHQGGHQRTGECTKKSH